MRWWPVECANLKKLRKGYENEMFAWVKIKRAE